MNCRTALCLAAAMIALALLVLPGCVVRGPAHTTPAAAIPGGSALSALLLWTVGAAMVGVAASVAALVWLPTKKLALSGVAGFGALLGCALTVKVIQPYLGWIVLGMFATGAAAAVVLLRKYNAFGRDMSLADTEAAAAKVIADHPMIARAVGAIQKST